jgi:uncharacterized protein YndB with AHSA1/START domain
MTFTTKRVSVQRRIPAALQECWEAFTEPAVAKKWLCAAEYLMPAQGDGPYLWSFSYGARDHVYKGRACVDRERRLISLAWPLSLVVSETTVTIGFAPGDGWTLLTVVQAGFPATALGEVEADCYEHHWGHILDALGIALGEGRRPHPHRVSTGIVPMGATRSLGLVVKDVLPGSAADRAGIGPGDIIRGLDGTPLDCMEDFDAWLETRKPGQLVQVELAGRSCPMTLDLPRARVAVTNEIATVTAG